MMNTIEGGVTAAKGFMAASAEAGIKYKNRTDMALVYTESPAVCAGTFTTNVVKAAPVWWDKEIVESKKDVHAVVLNSGIANACTGGEGKEINEYMASQIAEALGVSTKEVLTASTGVIGMQIKKEPIQKGAKLLKDALADTKEAGLLAAKAIMTTDTVPKEAAASFEVDGVTVTVGGMSKGSGMIHPNMATMLAFITTDADISAEMLKKSLLEVVKDSFNMLSVDGDTSTNDTVAVLASGLCGNEKITSENADYKAFTCALAAICEKLVKLMAKDGEGATKLVECIVSGAADQKTAKICAKSVICSSLVKAAMFGADANWGRILCALGYSGADIDVHKVDVKFSSAGGEIEVCKDGSGIPFSEELAKKVLVCDEVYILVDLKSGSFSAAAYGCDLTYDYVKINGDYRT